MHAFFLEAYVLTRDFLLALSFFAFVVYFLIQPFKVEGTSMTPSLSDKERIFVDKIRYRFKDIQRGDILVFEFPRDVRKSYIKRVVGLPGDRVAIRDGFVFVNGRILDEPYVYDYFRGRDSMPEVEVKSGHFFVLGDCRSHSCDSRSWGLLPERFIYGKAVFSYWPPGEFGKLR